MVNDTEASANVSEPRDQIASRHTPEPWTFGMLYVTKHDHPPNPARDAAGYLLIAKHPTGEVQPDGGEWEANARRIVACVNACEGISTELLENDPTSCATWIDDIGKLVQQRDELLAACKSICGVFEGQDDVPLYVAKARAAIAKVSP